MEFFMKKIIIYILCVCLMFTFIFSKSVFAKNNKNETVENSLIEKEITAKAAVLMEPESKTILVNKNGDEKLCPASITKIMTLLLIFEELEAGKIKLDDMVTTSEHAKSMGGSQVFLETGEQQSVETLIKCIVVASGNDASVAMAEYIAGSESKFVDRMNKKAKELNMNNTNFEDCCGLTDSDNHYSSANDVAIMSSELITKYPQIFKYSTIWMETIIHKTDKGEKEFVLSNTNKLLKTNDCIKGLKTGSTSKAKYCVSIVGQKNDVTLVSVIMAAPDYKARFSESEKLINYGFSKCKFYKDENVHKSNVKIKNGKKEYVKSGVKNKFSYVEIKDRDISNIKSKDKIKTNIKAPVKKGDKLGVCEYFIDKEKIGETEIISYENVEKNNFITEYFKMFKNVFRCCI